MASTYSPLKIELIGTGEQAGTWGSTTNTNLGTAIEQAIGGKADITLSSTSTTLTLTDTNALQDARALYLNLTGTPGGAATLNVPGVEKAYIVRNGTNQTVTVKVTGQTGVAVPVGKTMHLYNNGTDVVNALNNLPSGTTIGNSSIVTSVSGTGTVQGLTLSGTVTSSGNLTLGGSLSAVNLASQVTGTLPIANGGTGTTSTQFTNLTTNVTGTLPIANGGTAQSTYATGDLLYASATNTLAKRPIGTTGQVLTVSGGVPVWSTPAAGGVTSVTASSPLASSGGATPNISFTGTLGVTNGGTGQTSYTNGQLLIGNSTGNTLTKATLTQGSGISITNGAGSITIAATATGDVTGPASSYTYEIPVFSDSTGKVLTNGVAGLVGTTTSLALGYDIANTGSTNTITYGNYTASNGSTNVTVVGHNISASSSTDTTAVGSNIDSAGSQECVLVGASLTNNSAARSIYIGYNAGSNSVSDAITIGTNIGSVANEFRFGKSGNVVYNQFTVNNSWTRSSDERLKRNIQDDTLGLAFITKLRPVTFQWKPSNEVPEELTNHHFEDNKMDLEATMNGFIAQEVKQALDEVGAGTQGVWSVENDGTQAVSREMFIMPLVNAVKELKAELDAVKAELAALKG